MAKPERELYGEAIRKILVSGAGKTPDARQVAETTLNIWQQMATWLAPVIGVRGVDVLFSRALYLTSKTFPQLMIAEDQQRDNAALLENLKVCLVGSATGDALAASYSLLVTFTELLSTLIGKSLTEQLLRPVWTTALPTPEEETE